jgi:hypothetical protein
VIIDDHRKLHCPLTFFQQNIFNPYKKGTGKSNTMAKGIRGAQSIKPGKRSCHIILQKIVWPSSSWVFYLVIVTRHVISTLSEAITSENQNQNIQDL